MTLQTKMNAQVVHTSAPVVAWQDALSLAQTHLVVTHVAAQLAMYWMLTALRVLVSRMRLNQRYSGL